MHFEENGQNTIQNLKTYICGEQLEGFGILYPAERSGNRRSGCTAGYGDFPRVAAINKKSIDV